MPGPAQFPSPDVSSNNPKYSSFISLPDEFQVLTSAYDDGGKDFALQAGGNGIKTWMIDYLSLTLAEAAILDAHVASAKYSPDEGSAFGFNLYDRDTATLYGAVHYAPGGYTRKAHKNKQIQSRSIILIKYP